MFILAEVDVLGLLHQYFFLWCASSKILGGCKKHKKELKMAILKLLVLPYMHTTLIFFILLNEQYEQVL